MNMVGGCLMGKSPSSPGEHNLPSSLASGSDILVLDSGESPGEILTVIFGFCYWKQLQKESEHWLRSSPVRAITMEVKHCQEIKKKAAVVAF